MGPLTASRISHLFITVRDHSSMVAFYRDTLGLPLIAHQENQFAFFEPGGGARIALYSGRLSEPHGAEHRFTVFDLEDLDAARRDLIALGVEVSEIEEVPFGRAATFADPEGNIIEIHQPL